MILLAVIALSGALWLMSALRTPINRTALEREHNAQVLAEAKRALLGYIASTAADTSEVYPGRLPCPEHAWYIGNADKEGIQGPSVGVASPGWGSSDCSMVGRLPWRSLGIDKLRDAAGEPLWYVVTIGASGWAYENTDISHPHPRLSINSNKQGGLTVNGSKVVAAIIAPGRPLGLNPTAAQSAAGCGGAHVQNRITNGATYYQEFLECHNFATGVLATDVVANTTNPVFNDQLVTISAAEVMNAIEGIVAARIKSQVVPQIQSVYASASWGASAANPVFPFAVDYPTSGGLDAAASPFEGQVDKTEGLLPVTASTCSAITAGRCDATFVQWKPSTVTVSHSGGDNTFWSSDCTASTAAEIVCSVTYGKGLCLGIIFNAICSTSGGTLNITATGSNVGMALRTLTTTPVSGVTSPTLSAPFITSGTDRGGVSATLQGTLATVTGCQMSVNLLGLYFCVSLGGITTTQTVRIPIGVFADHPFLAPATSDSWYWFFANNWHQVTYYAVSPDHVPTGARDCVASGNCLTVNMQDGVALSNQRALLSLAGRSLAGTAGSNRTLADFLDTPENRNQDRTFEQKRASRTFNDRFAAISP